MFKSKEKKQNSRGFLKKLSEGSWQDSALFLLSVYR